MLKLVPCSSLALVTFDIENGEKGPAAKNVRLAQAA
jgi:hypothetical protein